MKLDEVRRRFLKYFSSLGHEVVPSSGLVPKNDPTLLFTNAGMVQFKDYFLGAKEPSNKTATSCQLCMRAGGKHNDLENVGKTLRHLTLFEMLGNFSFGDYFKEKAVQYAWTFLTKELKIPKEKLYVSVHKDDDETFSIWHKKIKIEKKRIFKFGDKDNFWAMGNTGPCGPCSEIYYDLGEKIGCRKKTCAPGCDCDRYSEIWNLVFMEFNRSQDGKLTPLPKPSVDTGMGLERLAVVMQGVTSNYDIDLFQSLIRSIEKLIDREYGRGRDNDISIRVIADHIRSVSFLISEGVLPSNEGRGYVLRRILRRAVRHGKKLGQHKPFMFRLVASLVDLMAGSYPQLKEQKPFIEKVIHTEEERFLETLDRGLRLLSEELLSLQKQRKKVIPGEVVYKLYDTFGFPLDLIRVIADEKKLKIDELGFEKHMNAQRTRARAKWKGSGEKAKNPIYQKIADKVKVNFLGYEATNAQSKVKVLLVNGKKVSSCSTLKEKIEIIFASTPFYGEGGGQVGDTGLAKSKETEIKIVDTQKPYHNFIIHTGILLKGSIKEGQTFNLVVDAKRRRNIMFNHTATHMLHYALQAQLGDHVRQAGSLVAPDRLRFDFTHFSPLTEMEIQKLENFMNEHIRGNDPVTATVMSYKEATDIGAMALFGEKYGDKVRVLQVGNYSTELCGGTHLSGTGEIRLFKIISETALGAGVRRLEALTGDGAFQYLVKRDETLKNIETHLKASSKEVEGRVHQLLTKTKKLEREQSKLQDRSISEKANTLLSEKKVIHGVNVIATKVATTDARALRTYCDVLRDKMKSGVVVLGADLGSRAVILVAVTKDLTQKYSAHSIIQKICPIIGGKGGGRPDFAQGGGPDTKKLDEALKKAFEK